MTNEIMITAREVENGKTFRVGELEFVKFYEEDGKIMAMTKDILFKSEYGLSVDFAESEILKKLEDVYVPMLIETVGEANLLEFTTDLTIFDFDEPHQIQSKMSLATSTFYHSNKDVFDEYPVLHPFWIAACTVCDGYIACVTPANDLIFENGQCHRGVRPICAFNPSLNVYVQEETVEDNSVQAEHETTNNEEEMNEAQVQPEEENACHVQKVELQDEKHDAQKEQEKEQVTSFTNFSIVLENLSEEDKSLLFALVEKSKKPIPVSEVETGKTFKIGDIEFIKVASEDDKVFAVTKKEIWDSDLTDCFTKSEIYEDIIEDFLPKVTSVVGEENVINFETDMFGLDGSLGEVFVSKASLMTFDFYRRNRNIFEKYPLAKSFWLATKNGKGYVSVSSTGCIKTQNVHYTSCLVRPVIALNPSALVNFA